MTATIYALIDSRIDHPVLRVRYIGQTRLPLDARLRRHWVTALAGAREHRACWMRAVKTAGGDVLIELVERVPAEQADAAETATIARFRENGCDLVNRTDGGRGRRGWDVSEETRQKMRDSARRRKASAETRRKMSEAIKSSPRHRAHRTILHAANRRPCPPETRSRISAALRGEGNGQNVLTWESAAVIRQRFAAGAVQAHLAREFGCSSATIHRVVHGHGWVLPT